MTGSAFGRRPQESGITDRGAGWRRAVPLATALVLSVVSRPGASQSREDALAQLQSPCPHVRYEAARVVGDRRAVDALIALLAHDPYGTVRYQAAEALGRIGDDRGIAPLVTALRDRSPTVRGLTAQALGRFHDMRVVAPLASALRDADDGVRLASAAALAGLASLPGLVDDATRAAVVDAVEPELGDVGPEWEHLRKRAVAVLGTLGDARALPGLIAALEDPEPNVGELAAQNLGRMKDARAVGALARVARTTHPGERHDFRWTGLRASAVMALGAIGKPSCVLPLLVALQDPSNVVRGSAAFALGEIGDPRAAAPLQAALGDADGMVRHEAQEALAKLRPGPGPPQFDKPDEAPARKHITPRSHHHDLRTPHVYELPEGFRGWVRLDYDTPGCSPLRATGDKVVLPASADGTACTSSPFDAGGLGYDEYVLVSGGERRPFPNHARGVIHLSEMPDPPDEPLPSATTRRRGFFVGTEEEFRRVQGCAVR